MSAADVSPDAALAGRRVRRTATYGRRASQGRAEFHPDAGHQRAVPVQQELGAAAGAGRGRLFVFVPLGVDRVLRR